MIVSFLMLLISTAFSQGLQELHLLASKKGNDLLKMAWDKSTVG
jgi:hypothetical protein